MAKCRGCEAFPKCTAQAYGDVTCKYLRFSYGMDDKTEMTNADRFRAMSAEEQQKCVRRFWEIEDFADWLKQPAE